MRIIPAIDLLHGKCVRLTQGHYNTRKIYNEDPLEVAKQYEDCGIKYLHLVDLDGAKAGKITNYALLETLASQTQLHIDFGGGLKTDKDLQIAFESGADQVTGGSVAVDHPELFLDWLSRYGPEKIILGADVKNKKIATHAWQRTSEKKLQPFLSYFLKKGISHVICTDISKDGMLQGPAIKLYKEILQTHALNLIASGGISSLKDLTELAKIGCEGAIIGKALYEQKISLQELRTLTLTLQK